MSPALQQVWAIAFLTLLAAAPVLMIVRGMLRRRLTFWQWIFWWMAFFLVRFRWRCEGPRHLKLPDDGRGAVIICNHRSSIDPFFITILPHRIIHWMVAKEYMQHPVLGFFLKACAVIPVNRGGVDNASTRSAIALAKDGGLLGMFPEGRINQTDDLMVSVRPGAILVALRSNARVIPAYIENSPYGGTPASPLFMTTRSRLHIGEPIDLEEYQGKARDAQTVRELLLRCVGEIAKLAGQPDFRPEVAGRKWRDRTGEASSSKTEQATEE